MKLEQGKLYVIYSNNIVDSGVRYYAGKKNGGRVGHSICRKHWYWMLSV